MRSSLCAAAFGLFMLAQPALAREVQDRIIGDWTLSDDGKSCSIWKPSDDGKGLTMFHDGATGVDGLGFVTEGLSGVSDGEATTLQMKVNEAAPMDVAASGVTIDGGLSGYMLTFPLNVLAEQPLYGQIHMQRGGTTIYSFTLDGIQEPAKALIACGAKYS